MFMARFRFSSALAALALFASAAAARPANRAWLEDYRLLKSSLERDYANLAWYGSPAGGVDLPRLDRRTTAAIRNAATVEEARLAMRDFVAALDDGHFSILPPPPNDPGPAAPEPAQRSLDAEPADQACAARGYANRSPIAFSLPFESLPGFTLVDAGESSAFRLGILRGQGVTLAILRIRNFGMNQYPSECIAAWNEASPAERRDGEGFADRVQARWLASLAAAIGRLGASHPDALVVDVGANSGGNDSGDWAARLFTRVPLRSSRLLMTSGPLAARYLDEEIQGLEQAMGRTADEASRSAAGAALAVMRARRAAAALPGCAMSWVWSERRPWTPLGCARLADVGFASGVVASEAEAAIPDPAVARHVFWPSRVANLEGAWSGPLYVLTNGTTYSSAEMFAAVLQNNRAAKMIGIASGGDGCGFMIESDPLTLPNLGLRLRMANCVRLRADGSDEVAGIAPDLPVLPRQGESARARASRLAGAVAGDLASAGRHTQ
jgi:hypothetical protein